MSIPAGKLIMSVFVVAIIAVGLGFGWGASNRYQLQAALDDAKLQVDLAEARGLILDGRLSLYNNNFGDASRHFEDAKVPLRRLKQRYQDDGKREAAAGIDAALGQIEEAQRLTGKLDLSANNKAAEALDAVKVAASK
jgi:hypothetical protein